ncbi:MAG: hypothetical protein H2172_12275 [Opitutus sp.]|nr:hypothetical protein [Opitutus sp.]MCS6275943.1 hypothetical protein [Opitutus sp.]MCS6299828.1 hypothetical protein [Opitutus sp.]
MITTENRTFSAPAKGIADTAAYGVSDGEAITRCTFIGGKGSEALKLSSNVASALIQSCTLSGGVEDCVDILGARHATFIGCVFARCNAVRDCTIKGGAHSIMFVDCHGLRYIKAGDCTIYEKAGLGEPVSGCHVKNPDGRKTLVLCLNSEPFTGDVVNLRVPRLIVRLYFWARWRFFPN